MTFDDSRDNVTDIEANLTEADAREEVRDEWCTWPVPVAPCAEKIFDDGSANDDGEAIEEDAHQPSEYDEWQDYMGGDEYYDHSENSMW